MRERRGAWLGMMLALGGLAFGIGCSGESERPPDSNANAGETRPTRTGPPASDAARSETAPSDATAERAEPGSTERAGRAAPEPLEQRSREELAAAGRSVYNANCIACHNVDPTQDGALGPAVAGSSLELLEARVVHGDYPEGYEPKRASRVMVALPHLEPRLPELAAYLGTLESR